MASLYPWVSAPLLFPTHPCLCVHVHVYDCCQSPLFLSPPTLPLKCCPFSASLSACCPIFPNYLPLCAGQSVSSLSPRVYTPFLHAQATILKAQVVIPGREAKAGPRGLGVHPAVGPHCKCSCRGHSQGAGNGPCSGPRPSVGTAQHLLPLATLLQQALRPTPTRAGQGLSSSQAWKPVGPSSQHELRLAPAYQLGDLGQAVIRLHVSASPSTERGREDSLPLNVPSRTG